MTHQPTIGTEVVRSKGDYLVGRTGIVIDLDAEKNKVQVDWGIQKTWVKINVIEPTSIPYELLNPKCPKTGRILHKIYRRLA